MSCEIAVIPWWVLLVPFMGPAAATAACAAAVAAGARQLRGAAQWMREQGLAADQLATMPMAPVNLTGAEFCSLARACDLRVAETVQGTDFGLQMTPIQTAAGQNFGLIQADESWHLTGAADVLGSSMPKVVPEMANFHQMVNVVAATKAMAEKLGANLNSVQVHKDQMGTLYMDLNVPNPVESYRPIEMTMPRPMALVASQVPAPVKPNINIQALASQIAAAEAMVGVQTYQAPPEGYLRVVMEVEPTGRMHVSVLGDHGEEAECRPVAEALQEAFKNADVLCSLRSIGQAPPAPSGIAPLDQELSADRPQVLLRPRQIQYRR